MCNRTVRDNLLRLKRAPIRAGDISRGRHTENVKLGAQPGADACFNAIVRPGEEVKVPQWRIVQGDSRDGAKDVQRIV